MANEFAHGETWDTEKIGAFGLERPLNLTTFYNNHWSDREAPSAMTAGDLIFFNALRHGTPRPFSACSSRDRAKSALPPIWRKLPSRATQKFTRSKLYGVNARDDQTILRLALSYNNQSIPKSLTIALMGY